MVFSINPTPEKTQAMFKELAIAQKGDGEGTPIVGGPPAEQPAPPADAPPADAPPADAPPADAPAEAPPAETPPPAGGDNAVVPGNGVVQDGQCICMVSCSAGSFPVVESQGVGSFGGVPGSLPIQLAGIS